MSRLDFSVSDLLNTSVHFPGEPTATGLDFFADGHFTEAYETLGFYSSADFIELGRFFGVVEDGVREQIALFAERRAAVEQMLAKSALSDEARARYLFRFRYTESIFRRKLEEAAKFYWRTRKNQASRQKKRGKVDAGTRGQVTGGRHLDGFARLVEDICLKAGFGKDEIFFNRAVPVPGYYRPQRNWDVVVLRDGKLIAAIELKSQSGSFGNNFNNRSEEVLGVSRDFWMAYRERVFGVTEAPWLGYLFFLEDSPMSDHAVALAESPLPPLAVFNDTSYLRRYEILCERLMLERDYTATALLVSDKATASVRDGGESVGALRFFSSLYAHLTVKS